MRGSNLSAVLLVLMILTGCNGKRVVSEDELKMYTLDKENGLVLHRESNGVEIDVIFRPNDLVKAQQLEGIHDAQERVRIKQNFDTLTYFVLQLSKNQKEIENTFVSNRDKLAQVLQYLSGGISSAVFVTTGHDTIPPLDVIYSRTFGAGTSSSILTVFNIDLKKSNKNLTFHFNDFVFGTGHNAFEFEIEYLKKIPTLNLN